MTQEEKRIKIAETCGWQRYHAPLAGERWLPPEVDIRFGDLSCCKPLPAYFNDLNACHEMEKTLDVDKWQRRDYLDCISQENHQWELAHATAAQRAEAFGLTMKLWKEGE